MFFSLSVIALEKIIISLIVPSNLKLASSAPKILPWFRIVGFIASVFPLDAAKFEFRNISLPILRLDLNICNSRLAELKAVIDASRSLNH